MADGDAVRAADRRTNLYASDRACYCAWLRGQSRTIVADRQLGANYISLSHPHRRRDPAVRDVERDREILGRGRVVEFPEHRDDCHAGSLALVSECRLRGCLGCPARWVCAALLHVVGRQAARTFIAYCVAALDGGDQGILQGAGCGDGRRGKRVYCAVRRHDHRKPVADRYADGTLLRGSYRSVAAWGTRH